MTRRLLRSATALSGALALALCSSAIAAVPDPGDWTGSPAKGKGAKASVEFFVDPDDGSVSPTVSYEIRRCKRAARGWSETVDFAAVAVSGGAFKVRDRHRKGRAKVDVRVEGTFDSELEARGTVRATVKLRARRGRKPVTCKLPKLAWTAELVAPIDDEWGGDEEEWVEGDEDYGDEYEDEYGEDYGDEYEDEYDDEYVPEDDEYYDDEIDPGV
jgi:hypothetical protein